jgi:hypothetical protein
LQHLIRFVCGRINLIPSTISTHNQSPLELFLHRKIDAALDVRAGFGDYVQTNDAAVITHKNDNTARTTGAIFIGQRYNLTGTANFFSLNTHRLIDRDHWTALPMPAEVITFLNKMHSNDKFKLTSDPIFMQGLRPLGPAAPPNDDALPDHLPLPATVPVVPVVHPLVPQQPPEAPAELRGDFAPVEVLPTVHVPISEGLTLEDNPPRQSRRALGLDPQPTSGDVPRNLTATPGYKPYIAMSAEDAEAMAILDFEQFIGLHLSEKKGLQKHGQLADQKMAEEINQLIDDFKAIQPVDWRTLTQQQRTKMINSSMFLKEKYLADTGELDKLKARLVGGGNYQSREDYGDIASPTVGLSHVFVVATLAAFERRHVATLDIKGAYLNAHMPKEPEKALYMWLTRSASAIVIRDHPQFAPFIAPDGRIPVKLLRALYGTLEASKLWFDHITATLTQYGLKPNPSGECVFNVTIDGEELTVLLYVDDLFTTCTSKKLLQHFIKYIQDKYKDTTVHYGYIHNYLGMTFEFGGGVVTVSMLKMTKDIIFAHKLTKQRKWPTTANLFVIDPESPLLPEKRRKAFHSGVMKIRYLSQRVRPETLCPISFLSTRVLCATEQDEEKLLHVIEYLATDPAMGITLSIGEDGLNVFAFIDSSFACHHDFKGQTGGVITLGGGPVIASSLKQALVCKSSTESELVGVSDFASAVIGLRDFVIAQGYEIEPATVWQDNMSTLALIQRGRPASDRSRHIHIRYFFVKERVTTGELRFAHKRTEEMVADILTKPLQGEIFLRLRALLLNTAQRV